MSSSGARIFLWLAHIVPFDVTMPLPTKGPSSFCWYEGFQKSKDVHVVISLTLNMSGWFTYKYCTFSWYLSLPGECLHQEEIMFASTKHYKVRLDCIYNFPTLFADTNLCLIGIKKTPIAIITMENEYLPRKIKSFTW